VILNNIEKKNFLHEINSFIYLARFENHFVNYQNNNVTLKLLVRMLEKYFYKILYFLSYSDIPIFFLHSTKKKTEKIFKYFIHRYIFFLLFFHFPKENSIINKSLTHHV